MRRGASDRTFGLIRAIAFAVIVLGVMPARAEAWESRTHELIARLAIEALPASPLKDFFRRRAVELQQDATAPDRVLRPRYGKAEGIRHYIDLEYFGADPFAALQPNIREMERRYGWRELARSGTLPWTIEAVAQAVREAWRSGDCERVILNSGYLAHYVGDATQPLHTTENYDGTGDDRGLHGRLERAADFEVEKVEALARPQVRLRPIESEWQAAIGEIRDSNALLSATFAADRAARAEAGTSRGAEFERALMRRQLAFVARQVAEASSVLAAIWLSEWDQANRPTGCMR